MVKKEFFAVLMVISMFLVSACDVYNTLSVKEPVAEGETVEVPEGDIITEAGTDAGEQEGATVEEIGINTPVNLLFIYPYFDKLDKSFHALFKGKTNKKIIPDKNEMSLIKWMTLGELKRDISKKPDNYVPHVVFGLKKYFSEIQKSK